MSVAGGFCGAEDRRVKDDCTETLGSEHEGVAAGIRYINLAVRTAHRNGGFQAIVRSWAMWRPCSITTLTEWKHIGGICSVWLVL